jgi:hypothetical protein
MVTAITFTQDQLEHDADHDERDHRIPDADLAEHRQPAALHQVVPWRAEFGEGGGLRGEVARVVGELGADRDVVADLTVDAARHVEHGQRHHERLDPEPGGADAVGQPEDGADNRARGHDQPRGPAEVHQQQRGGHRADTEQRPDREVDAPGQDDHGDANGQNAAR